MSDEPVPSHLSVSSIGEFLSCPRKFQLSRIQKVQPSHRAVSLAFGTAFHSGVGLALFQHAHGEPIDRTRIGEQFRDVLKMELRGNVPVLFDDGESEDQLVEQGIAMLGRYLDVVPMPDTVHAIERRFRFDWFDPDTGEVMPPLVGFIDAVTETDGRVQLMELKSGKRRWDEDKLTFDHQLVAYRMAMRAEGVHDPELRLVVVTRTKSPDVQLERLVRTDRDEREFVETAANVLRAVRAQAFVRQRSWACKTCPYAEAC